VVRGFLVGSLALIALSTLLKGKAADKASGLLGWSATAFQAALSPDVAAIRQRATTKTSSAATSSSSVTVPGASTGVISV
jgi:hypothetical protein